MHTNRQAATIVGVLFILAAITAILGLILYTPILGGPDYLVQGAEHKSGDTGRHDGVTPRRLSYWHRRRVVSNLTKVQ